MHLQQRAGSDDLSLRQVHLAPSVAVGPFTSRQRESTEKASTATVRLASGRGKRRAQVVFSSNGKSNSLKKFPIEDAQDSTSRKFSHQARLYIIIHRLAGCMPCHNHENPKSHRIRKVYPVDSYSAEPRKVELPADNGDISTTTEQPVTSPIINAMMPPPINARQPPPPQPAFYILLSEQKGKENRFHLTSDSGSISAVFGALAKTGHQSPSDAKSVSSSFKQLGLTEPGKRSSN
ncbi:hypothetical protein QBC37DRAFT_408014 [Rhypophila decipiens]|uniref:Uncharacterized protein n=1 Tax=Rhypophila decipiens TaxID=261697 RepID=A0AAN6YIY2_9PEZI|nr:hypothetical protein QBC37DRAFT_408014 [Rhypophila decipiens]